MHLKSIKSKIKHLLCIVTLLTLTFVKAQAQEDEPPSHNEPEYEPYPQSNSTSCSGNSPYLCPIIDQNITMPGLTNIITVHDATELYNVLCCLNKDWWISLPLTDPKRGCVTNLSSCSGTPGVIPSCTNPITIQIAPGHDIDFNDLRDAAGNKMPHVFPLEVPPGVSIVGDYEVESVMPNGQPYGTRIIFPFLYEDGKEPGIPQSEWYDGFSTSCNMDGAFVFKLNDGAKILKVRLEGPKPYMGDIRWQTYRDSCPTTPVYVDPAEGMVGGILVFGNNCEVAYNEIFGFPHSGILVSDIVQAAGPLHITPPACFDYGNNSRGRLDVHHNYIHNCKSDGYGYGIYVGYKGLAYSNTNPYCQTTPKTTYWNYEAPDEEVFINNNIFEDNKADIDGSGGRLNLYITQNTFSSRDVKESIHFHNSGSSTNLNTVCNPLAGFILPGCINSLQPTTFDDIGLNYLEISNNIFYQLGVNLNLLYPNVNPTNPASTYQFTQPNLNIFGNYFAISDYVQEIVFSQGTGTNLDWASINCRSALDGHNKIILRDGWYHYNYLYKPTIYNPNISDNFITIDEVADYPSNVCATAPFDLNSETPIAALTSVTDADLNAGILPDGSNKVINQHDIVWFSSQETQDKDRNYPVNSGHSLLNILRFNDGQTELETETRADNSAPLVLHPFDEMGITRVNLSTMDFSPTAFNHWRGSNITSQRITVAPAASGTWLSFWIYDTYAGRVLQPLPASPCTTCTHGYDDITQPFLDNSPTGFHKFARISTNGGSTWNYIWVDDIEGDEGWQHITVPLTNTQGILEIGLESYFPVSVTQVRGVSIFIDDVYINSLTGNLNALANGDLEEQKDPDLISHPDAWHYPVVPHAKNWTEFNWPTGSVSPFSAIPCTTSYVHSYSNLAMSLSSEQVHSGMWAYKGYVRNISRSSYSPLGVFYAANHVYKSIRQPFNITTPPPQQRISDNERTFSFTLQPNPSITNVEIKLLQNNNSNNITYFELYNPQGNLIFKDEFSGKQYTFNSPIAPGIYLTKLINNNSMSYKKVMVSH